MDIIEPHTHMLTRTTEDYEKMQLAGVIAVSEPAFWPGLDRTGVASFYDYFSLLTEFEPKRAAQYGMQHFSWICVNAKEAENVSLSREVLKIMPEFLDRPTVLGIGEIGLNKNTRNELTIFEEHVELAKARNELILIHTPHLEDKYKGTLMILDALRNQNFPPERVLVDHLEEHTAKAALDRGHWGGMTIYPIKKCTPKRAVDIIERFGIERLTVNASADWGVSYPMNTVKTLHEMLRRGHSRESVIRVFHDNPCHFFGQSEKWTIPPILVD